MTGNLWVALPLACLIGGAFVVYLVARLLNAPNGALALCTTGVLGVALVALLRLAADVRPGAPLPAWVPSPSTAAGQATPQGAFLRAEPGALAVAGIALGLGVPVALYSGRYLALDRRYETYYPLLLLLVTGLVGMLLAGDLFSLYMFCELMSISAYALVAFRRHTDTAIEAGFKYLIMGSAGTATLLLGISFVYRASGQLALPIAAAGQVDTAWIRAGLACFLVGLGVKSAIVPLHTWLPDAHGRAPSSVSAMLSGIIIQSTFYVLLKASLGVGLPASWLGTFLVVLSLFNMTLGNGMALVQTNTKRMLAYSTVAQMGYVMFGVGIGLRHGIAGAIQAGFFLLLAHAAMKGLAFLCKGVCHFYSNTTDIAQLRGTAWRLPLVAISLSVALGGLAAVPPLAGFAGKWLLVVQILRSADWLVYGGLVVFLLNGALSLGYYLPVIGVLFSSPPLAQSAGLPSSSPPTEGIAQAPRNGVEWAEGGSDTEDAARPSSPPTEGIAQASWNGVEWAEGGSDTEDAARPSSPPMEGIAQAPRNGVEWAEGGIEGEQRIRISPWMAIPLVILGGLVLAMGLYPGPWLEWMAGIGPYLLEWGAR